MSLSHVYNPSKYFRCTVDEKYIYDKKGKIIGSATAHKKAPKWYWPRFKTWIKQSGYNLDFGTAKAVNQPIKSNRTMKIVSSVRSAGNFGIYEWQGKPSGDWYAMLLAHTNKRPKKGTSIKAAYSIGNTAPPSENGGYASHIHPSFAKATYNKKTKKWIVGPIHYSKVLF